MLPSFGARADRIMQLLLVPAVGAVTATAQMFLPGAAPCLSCKPKNFVSTSFVSIYLLCSLSQDLFPEDNVLLESMPVPWLQNSVTRGNAVKSELSPTFYGCVLPPISFAK